MLVDVQGLLHTYDPTICVWHVELPLPMADLAADCIRLLNPPGSRLSAALASGSMNEQSYANLKAINEFAPRARSATYSFESRLRSHAQKPNRIQKLRHLALRVVVSRSVSSFR